MATGLGMMNGYTVCDYQWLFLDLNSYFASVEQQECPALRRKPIAVIPLESEATCAIAASYEAKAYGVKTGTKVYEAKRLCPNITFVLARHNVYVHYHHRVLAAMSRHLPVESIESIDEAACRLMGKQCNKHAALRIANAIKTDIATTVGECITSSIGIAPNKYLAKVATELQKPDGLVIIRKETMHAQLCQLSLLDFPGIGAGMLRRLHRHNIYTTEQLLSLSRKHMRHIWGSVSGERFWYGLHGIHLDAAPTTRRTVSHSHMLSPEWRPLGSAHTVAHRLLLKAASRLRRLGYYASAMHISMRIENGPRRSRDYHFHRACDNLSLTKILEKGWEEMTSDLTAHTRIKKISITLHRLTARHNIQADLFDASAQNEHASMQRQEKLSSAMDALNARYGRDTIVMGFLPKQSQSFSGTKIAFSRIPERAEFWE